MAIRLALILAAIVLLCGAADAFRITRSVSDLHYASVWFNDTKSHRLMTDFFTDLIANGAAQGITELVLIGDIVELWLADFSEFPLTPVEVLNLQLSFGANVSSYFTQLRNIAASGMTIVAMPGNHDYELTQEALKTVLPEFVWAERAYISDYARYEHSHYYDLFNAPYPDPTPRRPLGYYVARCVATGAYRHGGSPTYSSTVEICQNIELGILTAPTLKLISNEKLFRAAIPALFNTALGESYEPLQDIPIAGGDPYYDITKNTTLREVINLYDTLVETFLKVNSSDEVLAMIKGSCGTFDYFIENTIAEEALVMGHTHEPLAQMYFRSGKLAEQLGPQTAYVNSGAWVTNGTFTYVDTVYDYWPECTHPTRLVQYAYTDNGPIETNSLWLYSPDFDQVVRNTGEVGSNALKFRCGKSVKCPSKNACDEGQGRANLITLAMLSAAGVLVLDDERGALWRGKYFYASQGNLTAVDDGDAGVRLFYEAENGTSSLAFLAQWWSDIGSQMGPVVVNSLRGVAVLPFDPCPIPKTGETHYLSDLRLGASIGVAIVIGVVGFAVLTTLIFAVYWFAVKPRVSPLP